MKPDTKKIWKLYISTKMGRTWTKWNGEGISKSRAKCKKQGVKVKANANRDTRYKVISVSKKGYSPPYETL